ncbi:uncharacterized protein LOC103710643 isoform X2 [Phoenix dactylifera]|uniref:Uncharacterized protein LOC103710643 isoform X2 n=1 Tax=Phoenix dactylifera TaxID=42345 RepID=A0A8B9ABH4_PHODC|nr:uncharacterized protein LOC103710643 isoform X2 [Phoenix dactylifera]
MATAAFRSTSRRPAVGGRGGAEDAGSSNRGVGHRRSRSLGRYSGRFPPPPPESDEFSTPRSRFVNKVRGSGVPDISLDDLADEFFRARAESDEEEESRSAARLPDRRNSVASYRMETEASRLRGRSVSRPPDRRAVNGKPTSGGSSRRQRSVSVARHRCSDSENVLDLCDNTTQSKGRHIGSGSFQWPSSQNPTKTGALGRSGSQKDFFQSHDSYSSQSSSLTDDEAREVHSSKSGTEKTIQAVYTQEKMEHPTGDAEGTGLYEAMRKEVRHAVEEIRTELEKFMQVMTKTERTTILNDNEKRAKSSNIIQVIADIRRNYTTKLEQSEKRKQELLAELAVEEQRGQELTKIVKELLPSPNPTAAPERSSRSRRRSNDRIRMSKHLTEEAERYFEDFLSNVEDTDMSSFDGERSDTNSTIRDLIVHDRVPETPASLTKAAPLPVEADGVVLPWLQWETSNDTSPSPCKTEAEVPAASGNILPASAQEASAGFDGGKLIRSSVGSWSPEGDHSSSAISMDQKGGRLGDVVNHLSSSNGRAKGSNFYMDDYLSLQHNEDFLFERLRQRQRIDSGSLILCGRTIL